MSRTRNGWVLPVSVLLALLLGLVPLPDTAAAVASLLAGAGAGVLGAGGAGAGRAWASPSCWAWSPTSRSAACSANRRCAWSILTFILQRFRPRMRFFPLSQQAAGDRRAAVQRPRGQPGRCTWRWVERSCRGRTGGRRCWAWCCGPPLFLLLDALRLGRRKPDRCCAADRHAQEPCRRSGAVPPPRAGRLRGGAAGAGRPGRLVFPAAGAASTPTTRRARRPTASSCVPVVPARGLILDRKGRILADNVPACRLDAVPERAGNGEALVAKLQPLRRPGRRTAHALPARLQGQPAAFQPVTHQAAAQRRRSRALRGRPLALPRRGAGALPRPASIPTAPLFAHVVGYVGRVDEKDLEELGEPAARYTHIGKTGLERYYDEQLRGKVGYEQVETNVEGRAAAHPRTRCRRTPGTDLRLSIDVDLQRAMVACLRRIRRRRPWRWTRAPARSWRWSACPATTPTCSSTASRHADYKALNDNPSRPQFNRMVLGGVAAGFDDQAVDRPGRPGQRLAQRRRTRSCPPAMFHSAGQRRG